MILDALAHPSSPAFFRLPLSGKKKKRILFLTAARTVHLLHTPFGDPQHRLANHIALAIVPHQNHKELRPLT